MNYELATIAYATSASLNPTLANTSGKIVVTLTEYISSGSCTFYFAIPLKDFVKIEDMITLLVRNKLKRVSTTRNEREFSITKFDESYVYFSVIIDTQHGFELWGLVVHALAKTIIK